MRQICFELIFHHSWTTDFAMLIKKCSVTLEKITVTLASVIIWVYFKLQGNIRSTVFLVLSKRYGSTINVSFLDLRFWQEELWLHPRLSVSLCACLQLLPETAHYIFLIFCMIPGGNNRRKVTELNFFLENSNLAIYEQEGPKIVQRGGYFIF